MKTKPAQNKPKAELENSNPPMDEMENGSPPMDEMENGSPPMDEVENGSPPMDVDTRTKQQKQARKNAKTGAWVNKQQAWVNKKTQPSDPRIEQVRQPKMHAWI